MSDPHTTAAGLAASTITVLGVVTGLDPAILIAGFAGAVWAQTYQPQMDVWKRVVLSMIGAVVAGYFAPGIALGASKVGVITFMPAETLSLPVAAVVGLTAHRVLGPALLKFGAKKAEELSK